MIYLITIQNKYNKYFKQFTLVLYKHWHEFSYKKINTYISIMKSNLAYYENEFSINRRENYVVHKNQIHFIKQVQFKILFTLADININIHSNFNRKEFINTWISTIDNLILNYKINDPYSMYKSNFPIKIFMISR